MMKLERMMKIQKAANDQLALTNCLIMNPEDVDEKVKYVLIKGEYAMTVKRDRSVPSGTLGTSALQRRWTQLSLNEDVLIRSFEDEKYLGAMELEVDLLSKSKRMEEYVDVKDLEEVFHKCFPWHVFTVGQWLVLDFHGVNLTAKVIDIQWVDVNELKNGRFTLISKKMDEEEHVINENLRRGILMTQTNVTFAKAAESVIRLKGAMFHPKQTIIQPNFKFEDMGIGGLDKEFATIFRRAFASRLFPPDLVRKVGVKHVKGVLLFGPPGTGKTLIARQIGKLLNTREPKVVNGPEILNKYVGQSEENIRNLFKDAEAEYKAKGDESGLHIIIFDELDAICRQRGSRSDSTGVGDTVVNQLLSKMDGVEQLNNILVIGMTNRMDLIDDALLRPGRMEVHMEISLPDEPGRVQIFKIHTADMRKKNFLADDVNFDELASLTQNFSGAEIEGLVKSATSFAFNRHAKMGTFAGVSDDIDLKISRNDFLQALDEVKPAFGVDSTVLKNCAANGIIKFDPSVENILQRGRLFIEQVRHSRFIPLSSILIHGISGTGKTALAATLALESKFPFVKLISPEQMLGFSESAKCSYIKNIFSDAYRSEMSVIIIDAVECIIDYMPIGPRFSNLVLQALLVLLTHRPPRNHRLLVLCTASEKSVLHDMGFEKVFNGELAICSICSLDGLQVVLRETRIFSDSEIDTLLYRFSISEIPFNLGIKRLLFLLERANEDPDRINCFLLSIQEELCYSSQAPPSNTIKPLVLGDFN